MSATNATKPLFDQDIMQAEVPEIIQVYAKSISTNIEKRPLIVKGIFLKQTKQSLPYNNIFYGDSLKCTTSECSIKLKIPEKIYSQLSHGETITVRGLVEPGIKSWGQIDIFLRITRVMNKETEQLDAVDSEKAEIYRIKRDCGLKNIDHVIQSILLSGGKPTILLITGNASLALEDVESQIIGVADRYLIPKRKLSLASSDLICREIELAQKSKPDVIALVRGGGQALEVFDDLGIAKAIATSPIPVVTAIGHAGNNPMAQQIADKAFETPTAFGYYLKDVVTKTDNLVQDNGASLRKSLKAEIEKEKSIEFEKIEKLHKENILAMQTEIRRLNDTIVEKEKSKSEELKDLAYKYENQIATLMAKQNEHAKSRESSAEGEGIIMSIIRFILKLFGIK